MTSSKLDEINTVICRAELVSFTDVDATILQGPSITADFHPVHGMLPVEVPPSVALADEHLNYTPLITAITMESDLDWTAHHKHVGI